MNFMCGQIITRDQETSKPSPISNTVIETAKTTGPALIYYTRMKDISELYGTGENLWTRNMMSYSEIGNRGWGGFLREECAGDICAFSSMDELTWLLTDERKNLFHKRYVFENSYV